MLRLGDQVVGHWENFTWRFDGELVEQVRVQLWNGITLIMNPEDFMLEIDDASF